jgi:glucokinase
VERGEVSEPVAIVGDIGGTNIRLAMVTPEHSLGPVFRAACEQFSSPEAAIDAFIARQGGGPPARIVLAAAGPVVGRQIRMTNRDWRISEESLLAAGFSEARVINDFEALARATEVLEPNAMLSIGSGGLNAPLAPRLVLGPGTGLGAAILVPTGGAPKVLSTEAGHMGFAPSDALEREVLNILAARFGFVSWERLLSGSGLALFHQVLTLDRTGEAAVLHESDITRAAVAGDEAALHTLRRFWLLLASAAGDLALACGARGGVYVAGGIAPKIIASLDGAAFRSRFEQRGAMSPYLAEIPVRIILDPNAALVGAAQYLR